MSDTRKRVLEMHLPLLSHYSQNSKNMPSSVQCARSHNPQMLLPSLHRLTINMIKHEDQNGSTAKSRTSTCATLFRLRTTGRQELAASRDRRREMHCEMKNHDVDEVGSSAVSPNYWNLDRKQKFHWTWRLYSVLAIRLLNYDPTRHSLVYDKF